MIYLEPSLQKKVLPAFHYALNPAGGLFLGASESIGLFTDLFQPLDKRQRIFAKKSTPMPIPLSPMGKTRAARPPAAASPTFRPKLSREAGRKPDAWRGEIDPQREADRLTVAQYAPPGVLINADGQVLQFRGSTGAYLEPPTGRATFDLLKMARKGLLLPLRAALEQAKAEGRPVRKTDVAVVWSGRAQRITIEVLPLRNLREPCYLVLFAGAARTDPARAEPPVVPPPAGLAESVRCVELERDLAETRDYLRSIQEQQEVANAELQAANEEGESANEELQSLNEELETSKEELESTNEELTTVNEEVVSRNTELNRLNNDLTNLDVSTRLAVVLLGRDLTIRRFSPQAARQLSLTAADRGRPLRRVGHSLHLPEMHARIAGVIRHGGEFEREVRDKAGRWFLLRVRPYLTAEARTDGAVLVLMDITDLKKTEQIIREEHDHAEAIIHTVPNPLVLLGADLKVVSANDAFYHDFKLAPAQVKGRCLFRLDRGSWNIPSLHRLLEVILPQKHAFSGFEVTHTFKRIGERSLLLNARALKKSGRWAAEVLLGIQDITVQKRLADGLPGILGGRVDCPGDGYHGGVTAARDEPDLTGAQFAARRADRARTVDGEGEGVAARRLQFGGRGGDGAGVDDRARQ
jgi:two-component system CheB/CheR fusion protein